MAKTKKITSLRLRALKQNSILKIVESTAREQNMSVYLVGGALRNLFVNQKSQRKFDWDFVVSHNAVKLGKLVAKKLGAAFFVLDRSGRTARVICKDAGSLCELDFSDFKGRNIKEDLRRRDFTINTLCLDLHVLMADSSKRALLDYFSAVKDIKSKCVRLTDERNFSSDPLRILRGFTFCATFGFKFDEKSKELAKKSVYRLKRTSQERITEELVKIFTSSNSYKYILDMNGLGVLQVIFPETLLLLGLDQGEFHHLDAWAHSLQTLAELEKLLRTLDKKIFKKHSILTHAYLNEKISAVHSRLWLLKLACILHDIGKPATRFASPDGKIHFYGHEKEGANIVHNIGLRLKLSAKEIGVLKGLVLYHLRAGQIANGIPSEKAKFRFFRDTQDNAVMILLLTIADRKAMQGPLSRKKSFVFLEDEIFSMIVKYFKNAVQDKTIPRLLNGNEITRLLDIRPSPLVGKLLKEVEEAQALKMINTKKEAKSLVRDIYNSGKKKLI
ncbi:MAG: HDIG domain-containing protein [Candidatus Omnitrophica bacterium]|nr:HDIG domain-containing protein [Candidatus Omnitrophota bacterium]